MPISEERLLQIAQQKGIDVSKYQQQSQAQQPQQPQIPQGRPQGTLVTDLLDKINPKLTNSLIGAGEGWQGKSATPDTDLSKLYAQEAIKKQFDSDPNSIDNQLKQSKIGAYEAYAKAEAPEGFKKIGGKIVKDPTYKRQPTQDERSRELEDSIASAELKDMAKALPKLDQANQAVGQLKDLYGRGVQPNSVKPGDTMGAIGNRLGGIPKMGAAMLGTNPELSQYRNQRKAFSGNIAKGGFGEAGMLTQQDIERITSILPSEFSSKEEADIAWNEIQQLLSSARQRFDDKRKSYLSNPGLVDDPGNIEDEDNDPLGIL